MNIHWEKIKLRCVGSVRGVEKLGVSSEALQLPLALREHGAQSDHDRVEDEPGSVSRPYAVRDLLGSSAWLSSSPRLDASHVSALGTELMKT